MFLELHPLLSTALAYGKLIAVIAVIVIIVNFITKEKDDKKT